ncbi:hypothetical protein PHPALM_29631, partial [Phytophthora palmivora]
RDLKAHYQDQVEALKADKAALKSQIADLQAQVSILKSRPDEDTIIPDHWTTIINVTALDERKKPVPDFKKCLSEERARQAAEEAAKNTRVLDLTRSDADISDSQSKSPRYLVYSSKSQAQTLSPKWSLASDLRSLKRRPSGHQPVEDSVLSANAGTTVAKSEVYKKLPGDVVWKEEAHSLFSSPVLVQMLVSVIFSRHLDSTPWTKYVPEVCYQMADEVVDRHLLAGTKPAAWGDLDGHVNYPESDVESSVDNPKEDPDYKDSGVVDSESEDEDDDSGNDASKGKKSGIDKPGVQKSGNKKSKNKKSDDHLRSGSKHPRESEDDSDSDDGRCLVSKPYKSLSARELQVVETPDCDAFSWLYYGIRVQRVSSTKTTTGQTLGFPDYEVHKHSCSILKRRWDSERYCAVIRKKRAPWEVMFSNRFSEFYFHIRGELEPMVLADVEEIVRSMKKHAQAFWERTHRVTMDVEADGKSAELHKYRAIRRAALIRQHNALIRKALANKDFPASLLSEPGIWTVPDKACPWIWQDPRVAELGGPKCLSLETQLGDLDAIEPARMQWANVDEE